MQLLLRMDSHIERLLDRHVISPICELTGWSSVKLTILAYIAHASLVMCGLSLIGFLLPGMLLAAPSVHSAFIVHTRELRIKSSTRREPVFTPGLHRGMELPYILIHYMLGLIYGLVPVLAGTMYLLAIYADSIDHEGGKSIFERAADHVRGFVAAMTLKPALVPVRK